MITFMMQDTRIKAVHNIVVALVILVGVTGCTQHPLFPKNLNTRPPEMDVGFDTSPSTEKLDCLSEAVSLLNGSRISVGVEGSPNRFQNKSELALPDELREYIELPLGRITNGLSVFGENASQTQVVMRGALLGAESIQATQYDGDWFGIGVGAVSNVHIISISLMSLKGDTREMLVAPVKLTGVVFELTKGASIFVLTGTDHARSNAEQYGRTPITYALQALFDEAVSRHIGAIFSSSAGINVEHCLERRNSAPDLNVKRVSNDIAISIERPPADATKLCVKTYWRRNNPLRAKPVFMHVTALRGGSFTEYDSVFNVNSSNIGSADKKGLLCLTDYIYQLDHGVSVRFFDGEQQIGAHYKP